ncbi:hypothetical protein [Clostridium neonatale]
MKYLNQMLMMNLMYLWNGMNMGIIIIEWKDIKKQYYIFMQEIIEFKAIKVVKNMKAKGMEIKLISEVTGLSEKEINEA